MNLLCFVIGFFSGFLVMLYILSEFVRDEISKDELYFVNKKGKWVPKDPRK